MKLLQIEHQQKCNMTTNKELLSKTLKVTVKILKC